MYTNVVFDYFSTSPFSSYPFTAEEASPVLHSLITPTSPTICLKLLDFISSLLFFLLLIVKNPLAKASNALAVGGLFLVLCLLEPPFSCSLGPTIVSDCFCGPGSFLSSLTSVTNSPFSNSELTWG
ncbi:hypothetical protein Hanom_Chr03g00251421 [Helianthus anomalus]